MNKEMVARERHEAGSPGVSFAGETPTGPFVLSLASGVLIVLGALMPLIFMGRFSDMMDDFRSGGFLGTDSVFLRIIGLGFGAVVLYGAFMLNSRPQQHATWGALVLIFAALSPFGAMGGFGIGMLAGIVGGGWAIAWKPGSARPPMTRADRYCPQCGRAIDMAARFCSFCGHQLPA